ncbi:MAG: ABC transporter ATP-binding protein [Campylobacterales bacterium]|nr:ABC transporter ATP-binding protein [Campylobacterales bacterium]
MIRLCRVNKRFYPGEAREVHALRDIDLSIQEGEFAVITGPSGCGKTTLLNAIGLLDSISSGEIWLDERLISALGEHEKSDLRRDRMGFVFQAYNLVPVLSARENIALIMQLRGFKPQQIEARVAEVAQMLQIEHKLDALPARLSGGEQQRVAVARAVAAKPSVILADEPTANLDSHNAALLMRMMRRLNEEEGITVLFSSHDDDVINAAKRIIRLKDGALC